MACTTTRAPYMITMARLASSALRFHPLSSVCPSGTSTMRFFRLPLVATLLTFLLAGALHPATAQLAVQADTVYTMAGAPIVDGVVLVRDGEIEQVGSASDVAIPSGYQTLTASVVTPGLIDAHSVVGLAGIYNIDADQDQLDTSSPVQPQLRAIDAYNAREELVAWVRDLGVTTVHTGHGPGAPVSGQTMIVKTNGTTVSEALVDSTTMVAMTLGPSVEQRFQSPGTRAKTVAMLREHFIQAQSYRDRMQSDNPPPRDLGMETLARVLDGELPALITAHRHTEILSALRLAEEFDFNLVLDGAAEAYMVLDEIQAAGVPVIVHPPMTRPGGSGECSVHYSGAAARSRYSIRVPEWIRRLCAQDTRRPLRSGHRRSQRTRPHRGP